MITTSIAITAGTSASTRTIANVFGALPLNVTATSVPSGVTISGGTFPGAQECLQVKAES